VSLLDVREDLAAGYAVTGRYSGRVYFTSTDRVLAEAVAEVLPEVGYEARIRQETCPHDDEVEIRSMADVESRLLCARCGRERRA
jgi:hypothetical protein